MSANNFFVKRRGDAELEQSIRAEGSAPFRCAQETIVKI